LIKAEEVTTLHFVPSMLQVFLEDEAVGECRSLRRVIASGEALSTELQERFFARSHAELHNLYGPTEAAVDVTSWQCRRGEEQRRGVPLGRAIANLQVYILDERMEPAAVGVRGEIYLGGVGVGRGYVNRASWTAERFIPNPHSSEPGARLYRTGDVGRWSRAGEIEYVGRADAQVKVRGQRIELGEIEAVLEKHGQVREAVVVVREDVAGDQRLIAYVVAVEGARLQTDELREHARVHLPSYMVPQGCVVLEQMPLTASGKVERKRLPEVGVERPELRVEYVGPRSEMEERIAKVWREVLRVERVGVRDNFFDVGGHSLLMVGVQGRLREEVGREVTLIELFQYPTIASLAEYLERNQGQLTSLEQSHQRAETRRESRKRRNKRRE
jgi:acyl-coenzyme A synthetase/AMP-(fatty) acid ligase/acyl carrier protein